ncbi:MAG: RsmB/NOP family class I SAM-dependent RNA methyltransferase [Oscillospiraceae bacterium]|nr:RsmB/NOP family class I SAM-dependent RNA methyltransferase [Oscillospiraceae bacterium]
MFPEGFSEKMQRLLGAEYDEFARSYDRPRQLGLRKNPLKSAFDLPFALTPVPWAKHGFSYAPGARPGLHPWHEAGLYYLQEPSAMAPAALLDAQPGERILDLCAAPGGKTTQIAGAMAQQGILVSNEINAKRAKILARNVERMGIVNALVLNEHPKNLARRFPGWFDRILVDAPCSGEGMFRKEQDAVTDWSDQTVAMCAQRQAEILDSAAAMLAPGGRLVYSTCTFSPEENEGSVSAFLHRHPDFAVEKLSAPWFAPGRPDWVQQSAPGLENTVRLWPHKLPGEGHYCAVLRRQACGARGETAAQKAARLPKEFLQFAAQALTQTPTGVPVSFGENWYLLPDGAPALDGLRVVRAGLALGAVKPGRFEPAHALALAGFAARGCEYAPESLELARYLCGQALPGTQLGWTAVTVGGYPIGWAKGADGQLKNHFPKGLRHLERGTT